MIIKTKQLDQLIICTMFALLPVDMITGIMLKNNILLPISIGQLYKLLIILLLFFRFIFSLKLLSTSLILTIMLTLPSIHQIFFFHGKTMFIPDLIKISKFLMPVYCFLFFTEYLRQASKSKEQLLFKLINFSYWLLVINILVKHIGLGYPAYDYGDIGTKGFFFAGNEISALLIVLSAIKGYKLWMNSKKLYFYLFLALNLFAGLTISSKTAILGIILIFLAIPFINRFFKVKKLLLLFGSVLLLLPIVVFASWQFVLNSTLILRLQFFYEKLDFWTFILSSRNLYLRNSWEIYKNNYSITEKIIGVGQSRYEIINENKIVEIDVADIFFAYGAIGLLIFLFILLFLMAQARKYSKTGNYPYARFVFFMIPLLFFISSLAGHVFGSGMTVVFLGILFSLMSLKETNP